jgi:hypothetical protein
VVVSTTLCRYWLVCAWPAWGRKIMVVLSDKERPLLPSQSKSVGTEF